MRAVTFDYWETLCSAGPDHDALSRRRVEALEGVLRAAGVAHDPAALRGAYEAAWREYVAAWEANRQSGGHEAAHATADALGPVAAPGTRLRAELVDAFFVGEPGLELLPGVAGALDALRARGIRLGIVCDVGFTPSPVLRKELARLGVLGCFDHWSFSDEVGTFKPDPRIFRHALDGLGVGDPAEAAHVGDRRRTDVAGARAMGMRAIRYAGVFDDADATQGPEGDAVIRHHDDLLGALGL